MAPNETVELRLHWRRFSRLTEARSTFGHTPCLYVQTDPERQVLRIGLASEGLEPRYRGGTGYALDAAMHGSGNRVYVAPVQDQELLADVERQLIFDERPPYNQQLPEPRRRIRLHHEGDAPRFNRELHA